MKQETCLLTSFISDNNIVSTCDFIPEKIYVGRIIYEVVRIIDGKPLFFEEHINRFFISIQNNKRKTSLSRYSLALRIKTLIEVNKLSVGNVRFQISFSEDNSPIFTAWVSPFYYPPRELYENGSLLTTIEAERKNPNVKSYNPKLVEDVYSQIAKNNVFEALLVNNKGLITEGSRSNIFFVCESAIVTPMSSSVLLGITRQKITEIVRNCEIPFYERDITYNSISSFYGAFITGTSINVLPVKAINDVYFNSDNQILKEVMDAYNIILNSDIESFSWAHFPEN